MPGATRRAVVLAACALVGVAAGGAWWFAGGGPIQAPPVVMTVKEVHGEVALEGAEGTAPAAAGAALALGERLTTGPDGRAVISRGEQPPIRLAPNSAVRLVQAADDQTEIELERGQLRARVRADAAALRVTHHDEGGVRAVASRQGAFAVSVREGGVMTTEVEEGAAVIEGVPGVTEAVAGERVVSWSDGRGARAPIPAAPLLDVAWPSGTRQAQVTLEGKVDPGSTVRLVAPAASAPVEAGPDGVFSITVALAEGANAVVVAVIDPAGRERQVEGRVLRDSQSPVFKVSLERDKR